MGRVRVVPIRRIKIDTVVQCDIFAQNGNLIAKKGSTLNEVTVNRLEKMGINIVVIEEGSVELVGEITVPKDNIDTYSDDFALKEEFEAGKEALCNCDIEGAKESADSIANKLIKSDSIRKELEELKYGTEGVITHSLNTAVLAGAVGVVNGLDKKSVELLVEGGMLHDVGKLFIDPKVLNKQGRLTDEEYTLMKTHSEKGYKKLQENAALDERIRLMAYEHHENFDGTGYPRGLKGNEIIPEARIIHVVDVYEAMTAKRCYKDPILPGDVVEFVMGRYSTMFDSESMRMFLAAIPAYKTGDVVKLSDGRICTVAESNPLNSLRPILVDNKTKAVIDMYRDRSSLCLTIVELLRNDE